MIDADRVKSMIEAGLPGATAVVEDTAGDSRHFSALVIAPQFEGKPMVAQHRMVMSLLQEVMAGDAAPLHALQLKTYTPESWKTQS